MIAYLAGPMRGVKQLNFPAFLKAAKVLRERGHTINNPAEKDLENGIDINHPEKFHIPRTELLRYDLDLIINNSEAIILLPDWKSSEGACLEVTVGINTGKEIFEYCPDTETIKRIYPHTRIFII